jgi:hypothetical protein
MAKLLTQLFCQQSPAHQAAVLLTRVACLVWQGVDVKGQRARFSSPFGEAVTAEYDLLVGADGVNSRVRWRPALLLLLLCTPTLLDPGLNVSTITHWTCSHAVWRALLLPITPPNITYHMLSS